jgi:hypothetical protein
MCNCFNLILVLTTLLDYTFLLFNTLSKSYANMYRTIALYAYKTVILS